MQPRKQAFQQVKGTRGNTQTTKYWLKRGFGESHMVVWEENHRLTWSWKRLNEAFLGQRKAYMVNEQKHKKCSIQSIHYTYYVEHHALTHRSFWGKIHGRLEERDTLSGYPPFATQATKWYIGGQRKASTRFKPEKKVFNTISKQRGLCPPP